MTLLTFCQGVADEIGVVRPGSIVGNPDPTARRLISVAQAQGIAQARASNWTILGREYEITTAADVSNYPIPDDWYKGIGNAAWDRHTYYQMRGNKTPAEWQHHQSSMAISSSFRRSYRLMVGPLSGSVLIYPTPTAAGEGLVIEYQSAFWCEDSNANGKPTFTHDADDVRLDHELFRLGLLWRMKRALGLDVADDRADYDVMLRELIVADINLPITSSVGPQSWRPAANVAEGELGSVRLLLCTLTFMALAALTLFVLEHGRLPYGNGEALNWALGL